MADALHVRGIVLPEEEHRDLWIVDQQGNDISQVTKSLDNYAVYVWSAV